MESYLRNLVSKALIFFFFVSAFIYPKLYLSNEREIQGITYDYGSTVITEDGNEWYVEDAPEFEDNTKVIITFNTKGTFSVLDDEIKDIREV